MKCTLVVLLGFVIWLCATAPAPAVLSYITNSATTDWKALSPFQPDNPVTLQLAQFDSSLGDLQQVYILLDSAEHATVSLENGSSNATASAYMSLIGNVKASAPSVSGFITTAPMLNTATVALGPNGQEEGLPTYNHTGSDFYSFGLLTAYDSDSRLLTTSLTPYIGTGTVGVDVDGQGGWSFSGTSDAAMGIAGFQGKGDVTIIYGYNAIPAPSVLGLAGLGFLALLYRRRMLQKLHRA